MKIIDKLKSLFKSKGDNLESKPEKRISKRKAKTPKKEGKKGFFRNVISNIKGDNSGKRGVSVSEAKSEDINKVSNKIVKGVKQEIQDISDNVSTPDSKSVISTEYKEEVDKSNIDSKLDTKKKEDKNDKEDSTSTSTSTSNTSSKEDNEDDNFANKRKKEIQSRVSEEVLNSKAYDRIMENIFYEATKGESININGEVNSRNVRGLQTQMATLRRMSTSNIVSSDNEFWSWLEQNWDNYALQAFRYGSDGTDGHGIVAGMSDYYDIIGRANSDFNSSRGIDNDPNRKQLEQAKDAFSAGVMQEVDKLIDEAR